MEFLFLFTLYYLLLLFIYIWYVFISLKCVIFFRLFYDNVSINIM
jgi:hypothetical protein